MKKFTKINKTVLSAIFVAMIFVGIYVTHIPIGSSGGYFHLGDSIIYICAVLLPVGPAAVVAAAGAALADLCSGGALWIPFTIVLKAATVLCFTGKKGKFLCSRNYYALLFALLINVVGYYLAEALLFKNVISPIASVPMNALQSLCSGAVFVVFAIAADKAKLMDRFSK